MVSAIDGMEKQLSLSIERACECLSQFPWYLFKTSLLLEVAKNYSAGVDVYGCTFFNLSESHPGKGLTGRFPPCCIPWDSIKV